MLVELPAYIPVDKQRPPPSIRLCVTTLHSDDQLRMLAQQVRRHHQTALYYRPSRIMPPYPDPLF